MLRNREDEGNDNREQETASPMEVDHGSTSQSKVEEALPLDSSLGVEDRSGDRDNIIVDSMYSGDMCV